MKIYIKNMACIRCMMVVKEQLKKLAVYEAVVNIGEVDIREDFSADQLEKFRVALLRFGLVVLEDRRAALINSIKKVIVEMVHYQDEPLRMNLSDYLTSKLNHEYTYLANLFSEVEGVNVEHFMIKHKIERVKELLMFDKLSLTEISYRLNYSSVAHLCTQFKKTTGLTPSFFKKNTGALLNGASS